MAIKNGDFIEIEYTGSIKDDGSVFDTTDKKTAEENGIFSQKTQYGPIVVVLGESHLIKGLDKELDGKEIGKEYEISLPPEKAFGKRDAKLLQLIPAKRFSKESIRPMPGMQVNVDGMLGIVRNVSGGRTIVDFNHPLASKEVTYAVKLKRIVDDVIEKISALLIIKLSLRKDMVTVGFAEGKATITLPVKLPDEFAKLETEEIKRLVPEAKEVCFLEKKPEKMKDKDVK
ncbi:peptidylprolyl isomerase [Candidatus Woesearchaeota archaeon CG08_land_8_20_14_0_20_43_7]|nr:MAG: peptidylprolyl isomerase [Candidatus Woesearchaeota archaeon CG08_land_8_20_14_0_20_43_7]